MSVTINKDGADSYFSTRLENSMWSDFDNKQREQAIVSATELITQRLSSTLSDETVDDSIQYYPDRAVYWQALYLLVTSEHTANGTKTGPKWPGSTMSGKSKRVENANKKIPSICEQAMRWMNWSRNPDISIARA